MLDEFDRVFAEASDASVADGTAKPLRLRKTFTQKVTFWGANMIFMPFVALAYFVISAEGLRQTMGIFNLKIYKLPMPGAGLLQNWDGWNRLDLSHMVALLLFVGVTFVWVRVFSVLMDTGSLAERREKNPVLFYLLSVIIAIVILGDCAIFYFGLEAKAGSSWGETSEYIPLIAMICYQAGIAAIGAWHADYHSSGIV